MTTGLMRGLRLGLGIGLVTALPSYAQTIDRFNDIAEWSAAPASGVEMVVRRDTGRAGNVMRVDFDFRGSGGWAAFRRETALLLPDNYEISFWLKGDAPRNTLEFKLIDESGENVWWVNRPEFEFRGDWRRVTFRKRHVTFAWGPQGGGDIGEVAAIEFAITAGTGGKGTVWLDDLTLESRPPVRLVTRPPTVTTSANSYTLDLHQPQEYGGVVVTWAAPGARRDYDVQISADGRAWQTVRSVREGLRDKDWLQLPEMESRYLRIMVRNNDTAASIRAVRVLPLEFGANGNALFEAIAAERAGDAYPLYFRGTQTYWTVVGNPAAEREAMINGSGAVEVGKRSFSLEPFLYDSGALYGWLNARAQTLEQGELPIPTVIWQRDDLELHTTAWNDPQGLWLRYRVINRTARPRNTQLFIALRPFQVNPPTQFLNTTGGVSAISDIAFDGARVIADGQAVVPVTRAAAFGATRFDEGDITDYLLRGVVPGAQRATDASALASGALEYRLALAPNDTTDVFVAVPFDAGAQVGDPHASLAAAITQWRRELEGFEVRIPMAPRIGASLRSNLAYILINLDSAAIQPGSRSYERSWIRDGSLTSAALLRLGRADVVKRFIEWYAPFQFADGKVPCCVDHRGAGAVPENDSHGQLIYVIAEYFRYTKDTATVRNVWPHVERAVAYMDSLRTSRRTEEYRGTGYWGMMPQSISHEGYSAKPMHSYWDDFFALKGFKDAAWLAKQLGQRNRESEWVRMRDEFQADLMESFKWTMQKHGIDYLAGSVELGDFDATSTTVGLNPAGAQHDLPQDALRDTFDRYWRDFRERRDNWQRALPGDTTARWSAYTPYEWRVVGALVRLRERRRAHEALDWFMEHQRPQGWNHWAEVVFRDAAAPRFIGDMPHTWVGSDFIRSVLDMFVYDESEALIIGAGVSSHWVAQTTDTTRVAGIRTPYGPIGYRLYQRGSVDEVVFAFDEQPAQPPANGYIIRSPYDRTIRAAFADGKEIAHGAGEVRLARLPRELVLRYQAALNE